MRYKGICSYDGRMYCGWQRQGDEYEKKKNNKHSIQYLIEDALKNLYRKEILIQGASRTDAGVHAKMQVFHYDSEQKIPDKNIVKALNKLLPDDIIITLIEVVDCRFHCRYDVADKTYRYIVNTGKYNVFKSFYEYQYCRYINVDLLQDACQSFVKKYDFKALMASGSDKINSVREIKNLSILKEDDRIIFEITADGFLYHMVRIIIGALLNLNEGRCAISQIEEGLICQDRHFFNRMVPACGLYLWNISY